uniref:PDZ domain-containing protein n=1 Tax=Strigamia maritima TaxID=126957 RepID=T1J316_STRMM
MIHVMDMGELVNILLQRCDSSIPWGFNVQGKNQNGYGYVIYVDKVTPGTIASNYLKNGDIILSLSKEHARDLANKDLDQVIKQAGNCLELIIT